MKGVKNVVFSDQSRNLSLHPNFQPQSSNVDRTHIRNEKGGSGQRETWRLLQLIEAVVYFVWYRWTNPMCTTIRTHLLFLLHNARLQHLKHSSPSLIKPIIFYLFMKRKCLYSLRQIVFLFLYSIQSPHQSMELTVIIVVSSTEISSIIYLYCAIYLLNTSKFVKLKIVINYHR